MQDNKNISRGDLLQKLAIAPIAIGALAALGTQAEAAAKTAQSAVQYVNHAVGGKKCSQCRFFQAAKSNPDKANGACQIVEGSISPNGYCVAFAAKS